jgi:hypothetical protein
MTACRARVLGREQILMRLWELALLSPEAPSATGDPFKANQHALVKNELFSSSLPIHQHFKETHH